MKTKQICMLLLSVVLLAACEKKEVNNPYTPGQNTETFIQKTVKVHILAENNGRTFDNSVKYTVFVFDSQVANSYGYSDRSKAMTSGVEEWQSYKDGLYYHTVIFNNLSLSTSKTYDFVIYDNYGNVNGKASLYNISSYTYSSIDLYITPYNNYASGGSDSSELSITKSNLSGTWKRTQSSDTFYWVLNSSGTVHYIQDHSGYLSTGTYEDMIGSWSLSGSRVSVSYSSYKEYYGGSISESNSYYDSESFTVTKLTSSSFIDSYGYTWTKTTLPSYIR